MATTPNLPSGWTAVPTTTTATKFQPNRSYYTTIADPNNSSQNLKLYVTTNLQNHIIEYTYYDSKNQPLLTKRQNANIQLNPKSTLTTQQQQNLINNATQQTTTLATSLGATTNNTVIGGGPATPIPTGGLLAPGFTINADFDDKNEIELFKNHPELLIYPEDILKQKQDTLQISMYRYQAPKGDLFTNPNSNGGVAGILQNGLQRNSALKEFIGKVILPIPSGISDSNNVNWGEDNMNNLTAAATSQVMQNLPAALGGSTAASILQSIVGGPNATPFAMYGTLLSQAGITDPNVLSQIKPALASLVLKQAGFEVSPESILARGFGIVPNSNMELLFTGPTLRDFTFAYRMSPRSKEEARNVKRIIRFFKQGSAARKLNATGGAGGRSTFLGTPNVFKLRYMTTGDKEISGLNKFKICALRGITVNYAPDGTWAAYDEGQPVSLTMSLNFQELESIYNTDYQESVSSEFLDAGGPDKNQNAAENYSPVYPDDVGY